MAGALYIENNANKRCGAQKKGLLRDFFRRCFGEHRVGGLGFCEASAACL
jgi:hypothetical protein